eukprot:CAMPEP_0176501052 /NCGR_PEP_ID=MMETSP0200_2-20121128/13941_1 /TAXON_ID=947934 /ORGANISM="Chaetoceros sp., Strain GSL56" /LENGTH=463 /DNA_ID=CAMNT_0017899885 /DNA_START=178 /DNA_END=1566 /DNA_ORIENTATION=+
MTMMNWLACIPSFRHDCNGCWNSVNVGDCHGDDIVQSVETVAAFHDTNLSTVMAAKTNVTATTNCTKITRYCSTNDEVGTDMQKEHSRLLVQNNRSECNPSGIGGGGGSTGSTHVQSLLSYLGNLKEEMGLLARMVSELKQQSILEIQTTPENEFRRASRNVHVNPFEFLSIELDGVPLISRSALKLANIDAMFDLCLCVKKKDDRPKEEFLFVDLCGAPGGFSQYILFRFKQQQQQQQQQQHDYETKYPTISGYGMSLGGGNCDGMGIKWNKNLYSRNVQDEQKFKIHFGSDGTGDIYNWDNVLSLQYTINKDCKRPRVNLVVADGGIDVQRDCEDQEGVAAKLVVCQVATALQLLECGGNFVLKMFGFQSAAMRYVMETLAVQFTTVKIVKPIASRPASAERYVVALGFRQCHKLNFVHADAALEFDAFAWRRDALLMGKEHVIVQDLKQETNKSRSFHYW